MSDESTNMKKILILSYHFPPMNVIASQRSLGYANHFKKFGFEPTIVTHDWTKKPLEQYCSPSEFESKTIFEKNENYKVYRLPVLSHKRARFLGWLERRFFLNKIGILLAWVFGHLDTRAILLDYKLTERKFLKDHLASNNYDVVMGIFSPHYHLSNCAWAHKKFGVKYVLDFRDLWNNRIIHKKYKPNFTEKVQDSINSYYWKKWAKKASLLTITSSHWAWKLSKVTNKEVKVVFNGFESDGVLESIKTDCFEILHTGSIYNHQEFKVFFEGVRSFIKKVNPTNFRIVFLGAIREEQAKGINSIIVPNEIRDDFKGLESFVSFTEREPYSEVVIKMSKASLLYLPTFPNSPGTYGGKIFEYLCSGKTIMIAPSDNDVLDELITTTKTGFSCSNSKEISDVLATVYRNWSNNKYSAVESNWEQINYYSRESQSQFFANFILESIR